MRNTWRQFELEAVAQLALDAGYDSDATAETPEAEQALAEAFLNASALLSPHKDDARVRQVVFHNFLKGFHGGEDPEVPPAQKKQRGAS